MGDTEKVKQFWDERAANKSLTDIDTTHSDIWQRWLEIKTIEQLLPGCDRAIDIGCGSGYATKLFAPLVGSILGVDYSGPMIDRCQDKKNPYPANADFKQSDVLKLSPDDFGMFDAAISIRCLINLASWDAQKRALSNIANILVPNGLFIFVEGLQEGRQALNLLRQEMGLDEMPPVWNNIDFKEKDRRGFLDQYFTLEREIGFGTYDLISRVIHPLMVAPEAPKYDAWINELAAKAALNRPDDMLNSRVAVYCLRRK
jgi:SAM-dependent methyltransferase